MRLRNGLMLLCRNLVHRHEPPVTSTPVKILLHDDEREIIVIDKPGSIVCVSRRIAYGALKRSLVASTCDRTISQEQSH